jgi:hypothetical protein
MSSMEVGRGKRSFGRFIVTSKLECNCRMLELFFLDFCSCCFDDGVCYVRFLRAVVVFEIPDSFSNLEVVDSC